jgi:CBS domain-containing protein
LKTKNHQSELGDFTTSLRVIPISGLAIVIGAICAFVALALLRLIGLFTNLFLPLLNGRHQQQRLLVFVTKDGKFAGIATRGDLFARVDKGSPEVFNEPLTGFIKSTPMQAHPDENLRAVVYRMAESGFTRMPVVERNTQKLVGLISLDDLLKARARHQEEEQRRDRPLQLRFLAPRTPSGRETDWMPVN